LRYVCEAVQALPQEVVGHDMRELILRKAEQARESAAVPGARAIGERADASNGEAAATLDAAPKYTFGQTRRGWIWASLAIAAALLIMVFGRGPERGRLPVVAKREGPAPEARGFGRDLQIRAANEPAAPPATSEAAPPTPTDLSWQMRKTDLDVQPAPASGPELPSRSLSLESTSEPSSAPAAVPAQPTEEARLNYGAYAGASAPPATNKDESLAEGAAEMPAADHLAAATPETEVQDLSSASELGDASVAGQLARPADEAAPVEDAVVVVRVHAKRAALENKAFDRLLERSGIEVDSAVDDAGATDLAQETRAARRFAENGQAPAAKPAPDQQKDDATVEAVLVEASPTAIASCMDGLNKDAENFVALVVDDTSAVRAQSAIEASPDSQVFAKQQTAENLELSKYNRGRVPAELESLDRDKNYFYDSYGGGYGGGRSGGGRFGGVAGGGVAGGGVAGGELGLEQVRHERVFRARKTLAESNAGLAVRLKEWGSDARPQAGSLRLQSAPTGQTDGKAERGAAAFKVQDQRREMKEADTAAADNKLQVLFLFSLEDPAAATPTPASRGKAQ
jgi:hypothetical protein